MSIAETVKQLCKARGLTLAEIAEMTGVSASSLSQIMNGNPTLSKLTAIADALGVPVSELLSDGKARTRVRCPQCGQPFLVSIETLEEERTDGAAQQA